MSLETRLAAFISAVGADVKQMKADIAAGGGGGSAVAIPNVPDPDDFGFKAWSYDPSTVINSNAPTAGALNLVRLRNETPDAMTINSLSLFVLTAGATLTNVGAAIYDFASGGARLASTVNANGATATAFQSTGLKPMTFTTPPVIPSNGRFYAAFWFTGTTMPALIRGSNNGPLSNIGTATPLWRFMTANTGLTTTAPATIGTTSQGANAYWVAVS